MLKVWVGWGIPNNIRSLGTNKLIKTDPYSLYIYRNLMYYLILRMLHYINEVYEEARKEKYRQSFYCDILLYVELYQVNKSLLSTRVFSSLLLAVCLCIHEETSHGNIN